MEINRRGLGKQVVGELEKYCKFCEYRKKHRCSKYGGRIKNVMCDQIVEFMRQNKEMFSK